MINSSGYVIDDIFLFFSFLSSSHIGCKSAFKSGADLIAMPGSSDVTNDVMMLAPLSYVIDTFADIYVDKLQAFMPGSIFPGAKRK